MSKFFLTFIFFITLSSTFSQNVVDLVRYSNVQLQGSARFESMAGSFGALGADISTSLINPAGYGRFSSNQFNMGLNFNHIGNSNFFEGTTTESSKSPVRPSNIGIVIVNDVSAKNKGFLYNQIGFSYNRVDNFTNNLNYKGKLYNSLLDIFASDGYGLSPEQFSPFSTALAWETYAIDPGMNGSYLPRLTANDTMEHNRSIDTKGGISEYTFSFSTNYINKLYLGINWGIRTIRYTEQFIHREKLENASLSLDSFNYEYNLSTKGSGNNLKIGMIYLPFDAMRLGLSIHTPTFYNLADEWSADMTTYQNDTIYALPTGTKPTGNYKYRLRTPTKLIGSMGFVFGTHGCINVDLEYLNYEWANLKSTKDVNFAPEANDYKYQNEEADQLLRSVINIRVGGEIVFQSQYFIRGGYAFYPQPYSKDASNGTSGSTIYSVGGGIKFKRSTFDIAYKYQTKNYNYYAFAESRAQISSITQGLVICYNLTF
jgi:hypothetical protein